MLVSCRTRSRKNNIPFNLTVETMPEIPEFCPMFPWIKLQVSKGSITDASPTLDRNIPSLGYIVSNVRIISNRANRIKCDASSEELYIAYLDTLEIERKANE